jgi:hypothetical protein
MEHQIPTIKITEPQVQHVQWYHICCVYYEVFFRSAVPRNIIFDMFIFVFLYPLHVSALIGHLQAEYTITIVPTMGL